MSKITATVKGTKEQMNDLLDTTNCKLLNYSNGKYTIEVYLPERIVNHESRNRFHRIITISGMKRKLAKNGLTHNKHQTQSST